MMRPELSKHWFVCLLSCLALAFGTFSCGGTTSDFVDNDGDGWAPLADCDDNNSEIHPLAEEIPYNDVDEDCDGLATYDADMDGYNKIDTVDPEGNIGTDCDDGDRTIHPDAREIPYDNIDQDCDGLEDDGDGDGDGYSSTLVGGDDCCDSGMEVSSLGCSPATAASINPGAVEIPYDNIDQDCDGRDYGSSTIEGDEDGDGFATDDNPEGLDCDDTDEFIYPGAPERCNYKDDDCDGLTDEDLVDVDNDGSPACLDCDDYDADRFPGNIEDEFFGAYNDIDEDCDGIALKDVDGDTHDGIAAGGLDCNDLDPTIHPLATETCNHIDDDCDGETDEDFITTSADADLDGWLECAECNDSNPNIHPGVLVDLPNTFDDDCDGLTDETDLDADGYFVTAAAPFPEEPDCCDVGTEDVPGCDAVIRGTINPGAVSYTHLRAHET